MARDWKQLLLILYLTCSHSGPQTLPQMAKSELISGGSWCQQVGKKCQAKRQPRVNRMPPAHGLAVRCWAVESSVGLVCACV